MSAAKRKARARDRKAFVRAMLRVLAHATLLGPIGNEMLHDHAARRLANLERERRDLR